MKCCLAHLLPSGHVVPFCAYNTLYRDGHVPLTDAPGLGIELDDEVCRTYLAAGESLF